MNYLIPTILLLSITGIVIYIIKERYRDLHKCDCNIMDSTKNVECYKCKEI